MSSHPAPFTGRRWRISARLSRCLLACLTSVASLVSLAPLSRAAEAEPQLFRFHHEGVLGTSLDLQVRAADATQAGLAESTALAEIERLRKVLSTYDAQSEISRFNASTKPEKVAPELLEVLGFYDHWNEKSGGAYNGHLGELIAAWKGAEKTGKAPDTATLQRIVGTLSQPGWKLDLATGTATRLPGGPLTIDSLGKGYILSKAAAAVRAMVPAAQGFMLNIGGDIFVSGMMERGVRWTVGVADPKRSADNAPPLTEVRLTGRAISTSAAYERGFTVGGKRFSHILDPRTGQPAEGVASATVIAPDNATANAVATTLCVLKPEEGLLLVQQIPDVECLIVAADGRQIRSPRFTTFEVPRPGAAVASEEAAPAAPPAPVPTQPSLWPVGFEVALKLTLKTPPPGGRGGPKRPYVAVWVENAEGKRVKTVAVWGKQRKYLPDLSAWWKVAQQDAQWAQSITRATRPAGQHRITWDGFDDKANPLPPGTYTVFLEVNREHGGHVTESGKIVCDKAAAKGTIRDTAEFEGVELSFGPAGQ